MEAIKKKMQSMKAEKDNLMDRCDAMELVRIFSEFVSPDQTKGGKANQSNFSSKPHSPNILSEPSRPFHI